MAHRSCAANKGRGRDRIQHRSGYTKGQENQRDQIEPAIAAAKDAAAMAIKGVSLSEKEVLILKSDAGHPDNIRKEAAARWLKDRMNTKGKSKNTTDTPSDDELADYDKKVAEEEAFKPTIFYIGNLTRGQRIELGDMTATPTMRDGGVTMSMQRTRRAYQVVQGGLKGWDNMQTSEGAQASFTLGTSQTAAGFATMVSDESMAHLAGEVISEISIAILDKNGMRTELEKNFEGASQQSVDPHLTAGVAPSAATIKK